MATYTELPEQDIREENLINDTDFMSDIRTFLAERNNELFDTDQETYDAYLEHMRKQNVNELTAIGDLQYAQEAEDSSKARFARVTNVYDRLQGEDNWLSDKGWRKLGDYTEGLLKSPSTWIGAFTGGGGKAASLAAQQGIKWGIRKTIGQTLKGSLPAVGVEATAGAIQGAASEQTRTALGLEGDYKKGLLVGGLGGAAAGLIGGGIGSALSIRSGKRAGEFLRQGRVAKEEMAEKALQNTEETLAKEAANPSMKFEGLEDESITDGVAYFSEELAALDKRQVAAGTDITDRIGSIPREKQKAIIAAAIETANELGFDLASPEKRITQRLGDAMAEGRFSHEALFDISQKYNLTRDEMATVFVADVSNAAKLVRSMGILKQAVTPQEKIMLRNVETMQKNLADFSPQAAEEVEQLNQLANMGSKVGNVWRSLDKLRLGLMTSQITTTLRNAINVGMRLPLHMIEFTLSGGSFRDALAIPYNLFDKGSAEALAVAFDEAAPKQFRSLVRSAMDIEFNMGANTFLAKAGRGVNILNTYVDNTVKKAILLGEFRKIAGGSRQLNEVIRTNQFQKFLMQNEAAVQEAMQDTLSIVYQKGYKAKDGLASKMAEGFIKTVAHSPYSPLMTSFVPFPRYLANQTEFIYKHMPLIGMLAPVIKGESKQVLRKRMAQQVSGSAALFAAIQLKVLQGPGIQWNQYRDDQGLVSDIKALLGPFAPYSLLADLIYRISEGELQNLVPVKPEGKTVDVDRLNIPEVKDIFQAFTGVQGRAGTGLYILDALTKDIIKMADALNSDTGDAAGKATVKILGNFAANYVNSGLVPLGMFRDLQGTFDPEGRKLMDTDNVDVYQYVLNQALRSLPNTKAIQNTEEFLGVPAALSSALHYLRGGEQQQQYMPSGFPAVRRTPIFRQFTGVTPQYGLDGLPPIEEEVTRLGISRSQFFPYSKAKGPDYRRAHKMYMGIRAEKYLTAFISDPRYIKLSNSLKRVRLLEEIKKQRKAAGKDAFVHERSREGSQMDRAMFESLPEIRRRAILEIYKNNNKGKSLIEEEDWSKGLLLNKAL